MSFNLKRAGLVAIILIFIVSVGFNLFTALKSYKDKAYQEGYLKGQDYIVQQIKSGMQVNFEDGVIVFIKKQ